jgi:hypothetical protein
MTNQARHILIHEKQDRWSGILTSCEGGRYSCALNDQEEEAINSLEDREQYVLAEMVHIRNMSSSFIEENLKLQVDPSCTFDDHYRSIAKEILVSWFLNPSELSGEDFTSYNNITKLASVSESSRRHIWMDVTRTFHTFTQKSEKFRVAMEDPSRRAYLLACLCRILSVSSQLLGGWYCQGMSFVAASYILYFEDIYFRLYPTEHVITESVPSPLLHRELLACSAYYYCALKQNELASIYEWSAFLTMYFEEFEFQLASDPHTALAYEHMQRLRYPVEFFAMEWLVQ